MPEKKEVMQGIDIQHGRWQITFGGMCGEQNPTDCIPELEKLELFLNGMAAFPKCEARSATGLY